MLVVKAATTTTVIAQPSPSTFGQSATFAVTVSAVAPGGGIAGGTVTFKEGKTTLGTASLDATGQASFSTAALTAASHTITISYGGSSNFVASSTSVTQVVGPAMAPAASAARRRRRSMRPRWYRQHRVWTKWRSCLGRPQRRRAVGHSR